MLPAPPPNIVLQGDVRSIEDQPPKDMENLWEQKHWGYSFLDFFFFSLIKEQLFSI